MYSTYPWLRTLLWSVICAVMAALLVFAMCSAVHAEGLTVSTIADQTGVVPGQVVSFTSTLTNSFTASPPIEITATASYSVGLLPIETVTNSTVLTLTKPITVPSITLPLNSNFALVDGSCKLDNAAVTPAIANGVLTIPVTKTLTEGQTVTVTFRLKAQ